MSRPINAVPPSDWPIAVYQAVEGQIPGEPFVAYPMIPTVTKGERTYLPAVRCPGQTAGQARRAAEGWIEAEVAKHASRAAGRVASVEKGRATKAGRRNG